MGEGLPTKTLYFRPFFDTPSWFGLYNHQCYMVISQINKEEKDVDKQGEHFWSFYPLNTFFRDPPFWMLLWYPDVCFPIFEKKKDAKSRDFILKWVSWGRNGNYFWLYAKMYIIWSFYSLFVLTLNKATKINMGPKHSIFYLLRNKTSTWKEVFKYE